MDTEFLFVTTGSAGDLFPFLRMAQSLRARGHAVRLMAPALHEPMVRQAGIDFHGTAADPAVLDDRNLWHPMRGFGVVWRAVRPGLRELPEVLARLTQPAQSAQSIQPAQSTQPAQSAQSAPARRCVIIAHPLAVPDAVLARDGGRQGQTPVVPSGGQDKPVVAVVAAYLAPSNIATIHDPLVLGPYGVPRWLPHPLRRWLWSVVGARVIDPVALPEINAARAAARLPPAASLLSLLRDEPDLSLALFPPWFGPPKPDWPAPLVCGDFALFDPDPDAGFPPEVKQFLAEGESPLIFTHGTGNRQTAHFFACALEATLQLGRRAIFLTPHRDQVPAQLPPQLLWQSYLPLKRCLPRSALIVHHGGIGTTAEALHARVAQLVVPLAFDQFDNGARVAALGAGSVLPHARLTARRLAAALSALLAAPPPHLPGSSGNWEGMVDAIERLGAGRAGN
ncbi:glycosyltransferase [Massilia sp. PAMC28688]|uniref:nucleotide disphospho-sugar-binding domain-containing protein n=1 Tax=Massilia sp. PAMC28688 TaxID=2861283 RepID=UPI001C62E407|nr:nucleotide disphospho-sugar-binding domain-containing protein [Massilia sp. PAMC28688]QYF92173.1 glycosyltransferase [Massilia sp. PAMC28688]